MFEIESNPRLVLKLAIFGLLISAIGCVSQEASKVETAEKPSVVNSAETAEIAAAQKTIEKAPQSASGYNKLALAYIRRARETGDFSINSNAETAVNRALELESENSDANKIKASLMLTFHRFAEALDFGTKLQQKYPQDAVIHGVLTDANIELGNYKEAADAAQRMVDLRPNMESYIRVANVRSVYGDADGAIEALTLAARIADPLDKEARAWCVAHLGDEYFKIGRFTEAEKHYDAALEIFPDYHFAVAGKGRARAAAGDWENAGKFLVQAQTKVPLVETVIQLGDVYAKIGNEAKAREQYDLAVFIEQQAGNLDRRRLALLWADHDVKLDEALTIAKTEYENRRDVFTADIYAWCLYKKGDFAAARKAIGEALRTKTKNALFFYHAGMIEKSLGNEKAAREFLQKSLQTNPAFDLIQAEKARAALAELK